MTLRLHSGGRFRRWLGRQLGGDAALGDRAWRRILHMLGAIAVVYLVLPNDVFVVAPKEYVLLAALGVALGLELLRHALGLELPTIRSYEERRIGSFAFYAVAIVGALLLFPEPIAAAVVLGCGIVDPLAGEVRRTHWSLPVQLAVPWGVYAVLAFVGMTVIGGWPWLPSVGLAAVAAAVAVAVERPNLLWVDDDLAMMFVPALVLFGLGTIALGLGPRWI
jgi:dolichol kinase